MQFGGWVENYHSIDLERVVGMGWWSAWRDPTTLYIRDPAPPRETWLHSLLLKTLATPGRNTLSDIVDRHRWETQKRATPFRDSPLTEKRGDSPSNEVQLLQPNEVQLLQTNEVQLLQPNEVLKSSNQMRYNSSNQMRYNSSNQMRYNSSNQMRYNSSNQMRMGSEVH